MAGKIAIARAPARTQAEPPDAAEVVEQALLGAVLQFPEALDLARAAGLEGEDFGDERHRAIWTAIQLQRAEGAGTDAVSVFERLQAQGAAARAGGLVYLTGLCAAVMSAASAGAHAALVSEKAGRRKIKAIAEALLQAADGALGADEHRARVEALTAELQRLQGLLQGLRPAFAEVQVADVATAAPEPQRWWWHGYIPAGHVTLFSGHGGVGKSIVALMLAVRLALGLQFLGQPVTRARVLFFSAEDPAALVRLRLARIFREWGVQGEQLEQLDEQLRVIDATELDAALYVERRVAGVRSGGTTPTYEALRDYIEHRRIDVAILDNASDLFDADEIVRQLVRGFIRALAQLVRQRGGAVVLLAHVDKGTSRAGKNASSESYSGSTAMHNSVRSRLFLLERGTGLLELQHQKCNLGPKHEPLQLIWPDGGLPSLAEQQLPEAQAQQASAADAMRDLVALVLDYYERGEWVSTALQSPSNASRLLAAEARYPGHLKPAQVLQLLREAQRAQYLAVETYLGNDRKPRERWAVTAKGKGLAEGLPLFMQAATTDAT